MKISSSRKIPIISMGRYGILISFPFSSLARKYINRWSLWCKYMVFLTKMNVDLVYLTIETLSISSLEQGTNILVILTLNLYIHNFSHVAQSSQHNSEPTSSMGWRRKTDASSYQDNQIITKRQQSSVHGLHAATDFTRIERFLNYVCEDCNWRYLFWTVQSWTTENVVS